MATKCRKRRLSKNQIVNIYVYSILTALLVVGLIIGLVIGKASTPVKTETIIVETPTTDKASVDNTFYYDIPLSHSLQKHIFEICDDEDVPVPLVLAMIENESSFNPEAVSSTSDTGLMQINDINIEKLEEEYRCSDMTNPYQNVYAGIKIIGSYLKTYNGDTHKALMAYNMGEYGASEYWDEGITESQYSRDVLAAARRWEEVLR